MAATRRPALTRSRRKDLRADAMGATLASTPASAAFAYQHRARRGGSYHQAALSTGADTSTALELIGTL